MKLLKARHCEESEKSFIPPIDFHFARLGLHHPHLQEWIQEVPYMRIPQ